MGLADWYVNRAARKMSVDIASSIVELLGAMPNDSKLSEPKYRDMVRDRVALLGDIEVKREAGVQGAGTKIDLYAHALNHDFLITIKKGLNEQKIKTIKGEIDVFLDRWRARIAGNTTYVFVHVYGVQKANELEALNGLDDYIRRVEQHHKEFFIAHVLAGTSGIETT